MSVDLHDLGKMLREFAALEAKKRNWGRAQHICGLAMSAWQLFAMQRRHKRFLARERGRLRAAGLLPAEVAREVVVEVEAPEDSHEVPRRETMPSWQWYSSLRSTRGYTWARAPRLDTSCDTPLSPRSSPGKSRRGRRKHRGVKWARLPVPPWMVAPLPPGDAKAPATPKARRFRAVATPPVVPRTPRRPRTVTFDDASESGRGSPTSVFSPRLQAEGTFPGLCASPPKTASSSPGSPSRPSARRFPATITPRPATFPKRDNHSEDRFSVYAKTWPPRRAEAFKRAGKRPFGAAANKASCRSSVIAAGSFAVSEFSRKTSGSSLSSRITLKAVGPNSLVHDFPAPF